MSAFDECLQETLKWEGGLSDDPYDTGGLTLKGVTNGRYKSYRKDKGLPIQSVRKMTDEEMRNIYRTYYWDAVWGDYLPAGVDLAVFDFGVNSGPTRAIRYLQRALGVRVDGHMGPVTLDAVHRADPAALADKINCLRLKFVKQIKTFWRFGRGWTRRIRGIRAECQDRAGHPRNLPTYEPLSDADKQSREQGRADQKKGKGTAAGGAAGAAATIGTVIATVPDAPNQIFEALKTWESFAASLKKFAGFAADFWPYLIGGVGIWVALSFVIPYIYREWRRS